MNNQLMDNTIYDTLIGDEQYICNKDCEKYHECGSHIRFFGPACVNETLNQRANPFVPDDRYRKDHLGNPDYFWQHLQVYTLKCDDPLWFLTFRLYFKWITDPQKIKIVIGWIGRHLYQPCPPEKINGKSICDRKKCPLTPLIYGYSPTADDYANYKKQWQ
jgi:hypothetical protein